MPRALPVLIAIILVVFCLIDLAQTPAEHVRAVSRPVWAAVILFVPFVGPACWLAAGRPSSGRSRRVPGFPRRSTAQTRPVAPDDDPEFLAQLTQHRLKAEDERLRRWQAELERRERELESEGEGDGDSTSGKSDA